MNPHLELLRRLKAMEGDEELERLSPGLQVRVEFRVGSEAIGFRLAGGKLALDETASQGGVEIAVDANIQAWAQALANPPPPKFHSFTAWQLANGDFTVSGEPISIARARPALERLVELLAGEARPSAHSFQRNISHIAGRYHPIQVGSQHLNVYCEEAGRGTPVLFLHTAGADGRQFLEQMSDVGLAAQFHMFALDLPYHGKSLPPDDWSGAPYQLTSQRYKSWCAGFIEQVIGKPVVLAGCSMGAAMALVMAAERPDLLAGAVALEPPYKSPGRRNPYQNHIAVHGGLHNGAFVRGLMSPTSPTAYRRRASWIYSQGGPGVYPGDLAFYSEEFDGEVVAKQIDGKRTPVALLSGIYDYSATPDDGRKLAALIPEALHIVMEDIGHFPMTENPDLLRGHLVRGLEYVTRSR